MTAARLARARARALAARRSPKHTCRPTSARRRHPQGRGVRRGRAPAHPQPRGPLPTAARRGPSCPAAATRPALAPRPPPPLRLDPSFPKPWPPPAPHRPPAPKPLRLDPSLPKPRPPVGRSDVPGGTPAGAGCNAGAGPSRQQAAARRGSFTPNRSREAAPAAGGPPRPEGRPPPAAAAHGGRLRLSGPGFTRPPVCSAGSACRHLPASAGVRPNLWCPRPNTANGNQTNRERETCGAMLTSRRHGVLLQWEPGEHEGCRAPRPAARAPGGGAPARCGAPARRGPRRQAAPRGRVGGAAPARRPRARAWGRARCCSSGHGRH